MTSRKEPLFAEIYSVYWYCPETGIFYRRSNGEAITIRSGRYLTIMVNGNDCAQHRAAWLYMTGRWPSKQIDHKNRCALDNRFTNLRSATGSQNAANRRTRSPAGLKGVKLSKTKKSWEARVRFEGRYFHCGTYKTPQEAHEAYFAKAKELFGEFAAAS